ncbi:MAG: DUF1289 domain-containing protein, partial [Lentisphaeraceae bacterium]|nr:DUF1289 domain-containing protein [Lentisphaeraceae bacterium]
MGSKIMSLIESPCIRRCELNEQQTCKACFRSMA